MTALVVLPGLDGTACLLSDFETASRPFFETVRTVAYPSDQVLDYSALESLARAALPVDGPFVLLGESFSGPIALSIAARPPPGLVAVVLSATFARNPVSLLRPFAALTRFAPVRALPLPILSWFLLGSWSTPALVSELRSALQQVAPRVLRTRAASALRVDVTDKLGEITVPVLYLRASHDRLLYPGAGDRIRTAIHRASLVTIAGPHLLLQTAPVACAQAIADFVDGLENATLIDHCPVCGFGPLPESYASVEELRWSRDICHCCGCEFGYNDNQQYFDMWVAKGCPWFLPADRPAVWSLSNQISNQVRPWPPVVLAR